MLQKAKEILIYLVAITVVSLPTTETSDSLLRSQITIPQTFFYRFIQSLMNMTNLSLSIKDFQKFVT